MTLKECLRPRTRFPLGIIWCAGASCWLVVRAIPSGCSLPSREPAYRERIEGELTAWLTRRKERC